MRRSIDRGARSDIRQRRAFQSMGDGFVRRRRFDITSLDLVGGGTTFTKTLFQLAPREVMFSNVIIPRERWTGVSSLTIGLGITGNLTKYAADYNTAIDSGDGVFQFTSSPFMESVDNPVDVLVTAIGDSGATAVSAARNGRVTIEVLILG